ncbi:peptidoglycan recognition protein family protein [Streptomyces sp. 4N509B]|uniref:peptidoglycan recognition protein family protein n=1 Tax=Streptomyces sp. 4N509B TaxID=3457413 RepID=UPI003FD406A0
MASPLSADRLLRALRDEGVRVVEHREWRTNNRNHVGSFGPVHGVMIHHTVTEGTASTVDLCYDGHSTLPGPLCHGVIAKDGTCYLVGNGRANHAGSGDGDVLAAVIAERDLPADNDTDTDGNIHFYGFECVNRGDNVDPWPPEQVEAAVRASAAICRAHGWGKDGTTSVIGHLEWQPGKVDPRGPGVSMADIRRRVAERLEHPADWSPDEEDEMPKRALFGTNDDYRRTIQPNEWTTLTFNRRHTDGAWQDLEQATSSILHGPCHYTASIAVRVDGLAKGQEFQIRLANYRERDGGFVRTASLPIDSPVHSGGGLHAVYTWSGFISASDRGRVRPEVFHYGDDPLVVTWARAESLYWPG